MRHLIYIGPDKCGSSWLHQVFALHPDVIVPKIKDPFYFDRHYHLGPTWYESLYPEGGRVRSDVSHDYLFSRPAIERISEDLEDISLIVGVRDPMDRALSAYRYMQSQGRISSSVGFTKALATVDELLDHGDYAKYLEQWLEVFGAERFVYLEFSKLVLDSRACATDLCLRLGLAAPSAEELDQLRHRSNSARRSRSPGAVRSLRSVSNLIRRSGASGMIQRVKDSPTVMSLLFADLSSNDKQHDATLLDAARDTHRDRVHASLSQAAILARDASFINLIHHYER